MNAFELLSVKVYMVVFIFDFGESQFYFYDRKTF